MKYKHKLWIDASSGFIATMLSSPFNFVRNIQYATAKDEKKIPSMMTVMRALYYDGMKESDGGVFKAVQYWMFRLRIGWGTARVAVGMRVTSFGYEITQKIVDC